jgi:hypothetical protein
MERKDEKGSEEDDYFLKTYELHFRNLIENH